MAKKISALVLAAGASERMAQPKMLLPFGERTILTATLEAVLASGACAETAEAARPVRRSIESLFMLSYH